MTSRPPPALSPTSPAAPYLLSTDGRSSMTRMPTPPSPLQSFDHLSQCRCCPYRSYRCSDQKLVTCVQTWYYFVHYPSDPWHIKFLVSLRELLSVSSNFLLQVIIVLLLDTGHQALITHLGKYARPPVGICVFIYS
ncbi:hypothetical protein J3R82DRAFT_4484 [Butyriboletus roseoflavus]|nr:hypothetical protein J3R82DRAFT_4484 [Butyriboletus roseoflavus]